MTTPSPCRTSSDSPATTTRSRASAEAGQARDHDVVERDEPARGLRPDLAPPAPCARRAAPGRRASRSSASASSSPRMSARKPTWPKLTPSTAACWAIATCSARRMVPSPPSAMTSWQPASTPLGSALVPRSTTSRPCRAAHARIVSSCAAHELADWASTPTAAVSDAGASVNGCMIASVAGQRLGRPSTSRRRRASASAASKPWAASQPAAPPWRSSMSSSARLIVSGRGRCDSVGAALEVGGVGRRRAQAGQQRLEALAGRDVVGDDRRALRTDQLERQGAHHPGPVLARGAVHDDAARCVRDVAQRLHHRIGAVQQVAQVGLHGARLAAVVLELPPLPGQGAVEPRRPSARRPRA